MVLLWVDLCRLQIRKSIFFAKYFVMYFHHIISGGMRREWREKEKLREREREYETEIEQAKGLT